MNQLLRNKKLLLLFLLVTIFVSLISSFALAQVKPHETIDRIQLVTQQIDLLKNRLVQANQELTTLQKQHDTVVSELVLEKSSKSLLDRASLDIIVAKSRLANLNMEITNAQQTVNWLEKSIQEIKNQLNILSIFGLKVSESKLINKSELNVDLTYQENLLSLEKKRVKSLQELHNVSTNILNYRNETYNRLNALLKSFRLMHVKQQQMKDELIYQELQYKQLNDLNALYKKIDHVNLVDSKKEYVNLERDIFSTNEKVDIAHTQSLIARFQDQLQQMKLVMMRSNAVSLFNEISDQSQTLNKQLIQLTDFVNGKIKLIDKHLSRFKPQDPKQEIPYYKQLQALKSTYLLLAKHINELNNSLTDFRTSLDKSLQTELSSRQGMPVFSVKMLVDLGRELLLIPTLTFQILKSFSSQLIVSFSEKSYFNLSLFFLAQLLFATCFHYSRLLLLKTLKHFKRKREQLNLNWIILQTMLRTFLGIFVGIDVLFTMLYSDMPTQNVNLFLYLFSVAIITKAIKCIARICLVETTHDTTGHDVKLYFRLKWMFIIGAIITSFTVYVHQLPLIFELKSLCDRLFLLFIMMVSLLLLTSWRVVPNLILSQAENPHPYLAKSIHILAILIPGIMFANAVIGLCGYLNFVITISRYEGIFLLVLMGYLVLRGLLSDAMEHISRLTIEHFNNGWLLTEAFLKPFDTILRIALFFIAWAFLFLLYGWDRQSPMMEHLTALINYPLMHISNTTITPIIVFELTVLISIFYWTAKWTREFVLRALVTRTKDMGIRNSLAILSQYTIIVFGIFICLQVLGIDLTTLKVVAGMLAFGIGLGLRDLGNNFASGFLILLERPLRVGDIVNVNGTEGEVLHIGSRAVTVLTWDHMELMVPNSEIFNKSFINLTARDNVVRTVATIKISRQDNPHEVKKIILNVLSEHTDILKDPPAEVLLTAMNDVHMEYQIRYYVNIRQIKSRMGVLSEVLIKVWDVFATHGIKPPYPQHEVFLRSHVVPEPLLIEQEAKTSN